MDREQWAQSHGHATSASMAIPHLNSPLPNNSGSPKFHPIRSHSLCSPLDQYIRSPDEVQKILRSEIERDNSPEHDPSDHTPAVSSTRMTPSASMSGNVKAESVTATIAPQTGGKKRSYEQMEGESNKENEDNHRRDMEPTTGPSTSSTTLPRRKRSKKVEIRAVREYTPQDDPNTCGQGGCEYQLRRSEEDATHLNTHLPDQANSYPCAWPGCTKEYTQRDRFTKHVQDKHWRWKYVCHRCGAKFGRQDVLNTHKKSFHH
ncbi:hypothetical protein C8Q77DRAFT_1072277 [Trametes polyzona]|nr:hypothetical protein C8Q77DRAFT_1072277 [Trametes polyzona]